MGFFSVAAAQNENIDEISIMLMLPFSSPKIKSINRIGPHNYNILCILIGSLLGKSNAEIHGSGTRINFQQEHSNNSYLLWFHSLIFHLGYCSPNTLKLTTTFGKGGKIKHLSSFNSYSYNSFN